MGKLRVGLFFGGRSTEHEVSVITALQAYENMDLGKYEVVPVYVSKDGDFYTNPKFLNLKNFKDVKRLLISSTKVVFGKKEGKGGFFTQGLFPKFTFLDVAFLAFHGSFGEDGCIQGLLELYSIPYTGFNVPSSAIAMDKALSKPFFHELGLPTAKYFVIKRNEWDRSSQKVLSDLKKVLKLPMFVKPANIGSSIGVTKAKDEDLLSFGVEVAAAYSEKILVEEALEGIEVNCSALGYEEVEASVCEMPLPSTEVLSFYDKYQKGTKGGKGKSAKQSGMASLQRQIPAPIPDKLAKQIQDTTIKIFKALDGCGVARIDYFVNKEKTKIWVNEVNSPPGSMAFYLWEPKGLSYKKMIDMIIQFALDRSGNQGKTKYTFESGLLSQMAQSKS